MAVQDNLGSSDHRMITFSIKYRKRRHEGSTRTLNFKRANFSELCSILQDINWDLNTINIEHGGKKKKCFRNILNKGITQCIPMGNKYRRVKVKPQRLTSKICLSCLITNQIQRYSSIAMLTKFSDREAVL